MIEIEINDFDGAGNSIQRNETENAFDKLSRLSYFQYRVGTQNSHNFMMGGGSNLR